METNNFLRGKCLFPEDNGDDADELAFGDDDFPSLAPSGSSCTQSLRKPLPVH